MYSRLKIDLRLEENVDRGKVNVMNPDSFNSAEILSYKWNKIGYDTKNQFTSD